MTPVVLFLSTVQSFHWMDYQGMIWSVKTHWLCHLPVSRMLQHSFQENLNITRHGEEADLSVIPRTLGFILLLITYYYVRIHFRFTSFMREVFFLFFIQKFKCDLHNKGIENYMACLNLF